jgi:hypothetical protein
VVLVEVTSDDEARRLGFVAPDRAPRREGPVAEESDPVGVSCRVFRTPDGLRGAPTVGQLVDALRGAA